MQIADIAPSSYVNAESSALDFRQVMNAMAYPGRVHRCSSMTNDNIDCIVSASAQQIASVLVSREVNVSFMSQVPTTECIEWVRFSLRSQLVDSEKADFIFVHANDLGGIDMESLLLGSTEAPEKSTTLLVNVTEDFLAPSQRPIQFSGPGINPLGQQVMLNLDDVPSTFFEQRRSLQPLFPMGFDCYFCTQSNFIALPRTTELTW